MALNEHRSALEHLAEEVLSAGQMLQDHGAQVTIDARLRPEGRFGSLVRTAEEYSEYYRKDALTWERQVLIKARPIAGNPETGRRYVQEVHDVIYCQPISEHDREEVQRMKRKMESERLKLEERLSDLKLGHGGMTDIEFLVQLFQLQFGSRFPEVRVQGTVDAIQALAGCGAIPVHDAASVADTYAFITSLRNRIALHGPADTFPTDVISLRSIAIGLGIFDSQDRPAEESLSELTTEHLRRARGIVERIFYGPSFESHKTRRRTLEN
jgi:glutamate-ammonia-ligase adenylyltransferase